nr:hypothetical protein [Mesorhizobium sp. YR577]
MRAYCRNLSHENCRDDKAVRPDCGSRRLHCGFALYQEFASLHADAVAFPVQVASDDLPRFVDVFRRSSSFHGLIVTLPHKQAITKLIDVMTVQAREVGAVNAVRKLADGRLEGTQLDGEGMVAGLELAGHTVPTRRVYLAGAGGAAAGIAFALARHGVACITISNRTTDRATALAQRVAAAYPDTMVAVGNSVEGHDLVTEEQ